MNQLNAFRPYQLVHVEMPGYAYIGEVMSRETPDKTYMVRRVPGHPGTLSEIKANCLSSTARNGQNLYVHYAIVSGRGSFPVDMLRYDYAAPVNFEIAEEDGMYRLTQLKTFPEFVGQWVIATVYKQSVPGVWTPSRWASFGWSIKPLKTLKLERV